MFKLIILLLGNWNIRNDPIKHGTISLSKVHILCREGVDLDQDLLKQLRQSLIHKTCYMTTQNNLRRYIYDTPYISHKKFI